MLIYSIVRIDEDNTVVDYFTTESKDEATRYIKDRHLLIEYAEDYSWYLCVTNDFESTEHKIYSASVIIDDELESGDEEDIAVTGVTYELIER